jgi:hypothetical protein
MGKRFEKDPSEVLDFMFDWSAQMTADSDTIASHTVTVPSGITKNSSANSTTAVTTWLAGGTAGTEYEVTCQVVTAGLRTHERSARISVRNL